MAKKGLKRTFKIFKKDLNIFLGIVIFLLLIGSAFAIDWIFGVGFIIGFGLALYHRILERNFLIPVFIFLGAWIIRFAIIFLFPSIIHAKDLFSLGISLVIFLILIIIGWRIKSGKFRF